MRPDRRRRAAAALGAAILLLAAAALAPVLEAGFIVIDDDQYVVENPPVQRGLTAEGLAWAFTSFHSSNWHPLTWVSHMADVELFGLKPAGHHLTNLLLHGANALLLLALLAELTGALLPSALVAALFAVHPLHVQSVAWVAERKDVLAGLFWLLTSLAYVRHVRRPSAATRALVIGLFALGLMAKPMLVTLPAVLLLLDAWPLGRLREGTRGRDALALLREKAPLFALAAASSLVTFAAQQSAASVVAFERLPLGLRLANASLSCLRYLGKALWPRDLAVFYPYPAGAAVPWLGAAAWLVLAALTAAAVAVRRSRPELLAGWLWYLVSLLPVIGLVQVGAQGMADRYTYLPLIGPFVAVAWAARAAVARRAALSPRAAAAAALLVVALVAGLAARARREAGYWRDSLTLLDRATEVVGENFAVLSFKGVALARAGRLAEALPTLERALQLNPETAVTRYNLASVLAIAGRTGEAASLYRGILAADPREGGAAVALGSLLLGEGDLPAAVHLFEQALGVDPDDHLARHQLSLALERQGRVSEALEQARRAAAALPSDLGYRFRVGYLLALDDRLEEAFAAFERVLALDSGNAPALFNMARVRDRQGRTTEALALYRRALAADPRSADAHNALGAALAEAGEPGEAQAHFREALRIRPGHPEAAANSRSLRRRGEAPATP